MCGYSIIAVPTLIASAQLATPRHAHATRRRRSEGGETLTVAPTRACSSCESVGHDDDATHCKFCGGAL